MLSVANQRPLNNQIGYVDSLLAYYLGVRKPQTLSDEQWADKYAQLQHLLDQRSCN